MSKYDPLADFLHQQAADTVRVSFRELEELLGFKLPPSKANRAWWSNNPTNSVMTKVWLQAGWRTRNVDMEGGRVTFFRAEQRTGQSASNERVESIADAAACVSLKQLDPGARNVLAVLARRSGRSQVDEALALLHEALAP